MSLSLRNVEDLLAERGIDISHETVNTNPFFIIGHSTRTIVEFVDSLQDLMNPILVVEEDRHLAVAFNAGHRFDGNAAKLVRRLGCLEVENGGALSRSAADRDRDAACVPGSDR